MATALLGCHGRGKMSANEVKLSTVPVKLDAPIRDARLVNVGSRARLLLSTTKKLNPMSSQTALYAMALEGSGEPLVRVMVIPQLLPAPPGWDVSWAAGDGYRTAYQLAGGALDSIQLSTEHEEEPMALTASAPLTSFSRPRFFRGNAQAAHRISMIADGEHAVAFDIPPASGPHSARKLGACENAVVIALVKGFGLFCKAPGSGGARNDTIPGTLQYVRLGAEWEASAPTQDLLTGQPVFEFDAERLDDARLMVFALTQAGPVLLVLSTAGVPERLSRVAVDANLVQLSRPSILMADGRIHFSLLENPGSKAVRVHTGQVLTTAIP
ncbi:hypothetical protein G4177_26730 [Corallococcus sp. ZKHCc1 1396]|uniref:Uncharacterized protein n=1 Tax=Corallococcus soli TaxID=2710757 RepID=A0ABR9PV07_9BACT|nr:hypothetical protein [Corallococcus soli]MBE4751770.1 hypothetical protein [Corallococcus soli]